jgi:DNA-binding transcriptional regulator of glucitol operon
VQSKLARTLSAVAVSVLSLVVCLALAWWQWQRYESVSGTWQNLGYVLQWPLFGLFPAFAFWRLHKLRQQARPAVQQDESEPQAPAPPAEPDKPEQRPITRTNVTQQASDDADDELAAYNRYLAELHARDQQAR